jgi:Tfp pilus assembly protein PilF
LHADLLLKHGEAAAALQEYQAVLGTDPNRFRSVLGKARAAKLTENNATARETYRQLIELCGEADTERPELAEARRFLAP